MMAKSASTKPFYNDVLPGDWTTPEFGTVFSFLKSYAFSREQLVDEETDEGIQNIHYGDIHATFENEILDFELEKRIPFVKNGLIHNGKAEKEIDWLEDGDLIIADASEDYAGVAECIELKNINGRKIVSGLHTFVARDKSGKSAQGYRTYLLNHPQVVRELRRIATGFSVFGISKTNITKVKLPLPPIKEQEAIADLLQLMDRAINKNNELIAKKELQKKGVMQKLLTGEVRLKGFESSKWREHRLEDLLVKFQNGYAFPATEYSERGIPIITMAQIGLDGTFQFDPIKVNYWEEEKAVGLDNFLLKRGDLITAMTDVTPQKNLIGRMAIINENGPFLLNQRVGLLRVDTNKIDTTILTALSGMKKWRDYTRSVATLGVQANIGTDDLKKGKIYIPEIQEQKAIAQVLQAADTEIKLLKTKTNKLREKKKGLMQVLLTGKVRLKIK